MNRIAYFFIYICAVLPACAHGLKFRSMECPIAQRTSYNVFAYERPFFENTVEIVFDMALYPGSQIGYVIRVKGESESDNFNLFFDIHGEDVLFRLNQEGRKVLVLLPVNKAELTMNHWAPVRLCFDLKKDELSLEINGKKEVCSGVTLPDKWKPGVYFGKSEYIVDVPSIAIRGLKVGNDAKRYVFSLDEVEGGEVHDRNGRLLGRVENPVWLINESLYWRKEAEFFSATASGVNYDTKSSEIRYFNRDSLMTFNTLTGDTVITRFPEPCPVPLFLANSFVDGARGRMYVYEVYHDFGRTGPTMASLDLSTLEWRVESDLQLPMQLHHHDICYDAACGLYTLFGGFGNMHYSNRFYTFDTENADWGRIDSLQGDVICPRYFSAIGYQESDHSIYVFGGMGNESGEQVVGRRYLYDFYQVDLEKKRIRKLWEMPDEKVDMVPARGMVTDGDSCFYVLRYPESVSRSFLKLYRFSMADGSCQILADSISIFSDRITTNAHLYYNKSQGRLYATVQESADDVSSRLTVYSLAFPPLPCDAVLKEEAGSQQRGWLMVSGLVVGLLLAAWLLYAGKWKKGEGEEEKDEEDEEASARSVAPAVPEVPEVSGHANSLYLFGEFAAFDRNGRNITYMFSTRIRRILCLILLYDTVSGISSGELGNLIWPDKEKSKVKSSRGVAINQLRKILGEMDGIELVYEDGCFKCLRSDEFHCDFFRCSEIVFSTDISGKYRQGLLDVIARGRFLASFDNDPIFDRFKQKIETGLEVILLRLMEEAFKERLWQDCVDFAKGEFNIDPLNESALFYQLKSLFMLKRENAAVIAYQRFIVEYQKVYGNDFPHSFNNYYTA